MPRHLLKALRPMHSDLKTWPIRNLIWPIRNQDLAFQEPNYWPIRNLGFGLSGTGRSKNHNHFKAIEAYPHPVTRARDLNRDLTLLTSNLTSNPSRRLKRGLRPLGASNPPNPPYPRKARPSGEPKIQNNRRAAALRPAGK
jgi:hypothetical protein